LHVSRLYPDSIPVGQNYGKVAGSQDWRSAIWAEWDKVLNSEISVDQAAVNMVRLGDAALAQAAPARGGPRFHNRLSASLC
jgi:hypothetical protein